MTIRLPRMRGTIVPAYQKTINQDQKILFVGQMTTGTATSGQLYENIQNDNSQDTLFGKNSRIAQMIKAAKFYNLVTRMDAIPLADNGSGVAATGTIAFSVGTPVAGTLTVYVGSRINHAYTLNVTTTSTATTIGDALVAAITADTTSPVTAVNTTGSVALTAVNKGTEGNGIGLQVSGSVSGVTVTVTAMSAGATNPVLTTLFDVITNKRYQTIVYPSTFDLSVVTNLLESRWNVDNLIIDGVAIVSNTDTLANLLILGNGKNLKTLFIHGNRKVNATLYKGSALFELDDIISSQIAAIRALRLTNNSNIAPYVISTYGLLDNTGGMAIASLPYFNTPFSNLPIIDSDQTWTQEEYDELKAAGISVLDNNDGRTSIIFGESMMTYKTDAASNPDISFKYMEYVDTASNIREYFFNNLRSRFAQCRLTEGDFVDRRNMANASVISAYCDSLYVDLAKTYVLVPDSEAAIAYFKNNKTVTTDLANGKATITMLVPINTQLRSIEFTMGISFSISA